MSLFEINGVRSGVEFHALKNYYPKNRFAEVPKVIEEDRRFLYDFKDGRNSAQAVKLFYDAIRNQFNQDKIADILVVIPASTDVKTRIRFHLFCSLLSIKLGIENGYIAIRRAEDRETMRSNENYQQDRSSGLEINPELIKGKRVLLIDDIITQGKSARAATNLLMANGALSTRCLFAAATFDYLKGEPDWKIESEAKSKTQIMEEMIFPNPNSRSLIDNKPVPELIIRMLTPKEELGIPISVPSEEKPKDSGEEKANLKSDRSNSQSEDSIQERELQRDIINLLDDGKTDESGSKKEQFELKSLKEVVEKFNLELNSTISFLKSKGHPLYENDLLIDRNQFELIKTSKSLIKKGEAVENNENKKITDRTLPKLTLTSKTNLDKENPDSQTTIKNNPAQSKSLDKESRNNQRKNKVLKSFEELGSLKKYWNQ